MFPLPVSVPGQTKADAGGYQAREQDVSYSAIPCTLQMIYWYQQICRRNCLRHVSFRSALSDASNYFYQLYISMQGYQVIQKIVYMKE